MRLLHSIAFFFLISLSLQSEELRYLDKALLDEVRDSPALVNVKNYFIKLGEKELKEVPIVVTDKSWSFSGNNHYYNSISAYWWPVEKDGKTIYVVRDGRINPQSNDVDNNKIQRLSDRLKYLSYAYYLTSDKRYYRAFIKQIDTWFIKTRTRMYPNFEYAQVVPGGNNKGTPVGIIDGHPLNFVLEYIRLVNSCKSIGQRRYHKLVLWFDELADWMEESNQGKIDSKANSNQGVSYDVMLLNIALFTGNIERVDRIVSLFPQKRIYAQIEPDGRQPAELVRTNAFQYSLANLDFFLQFCIIADSAGYHVYQDNKERINAACKYLYDFVGNTDIFPYQQIAGWDGMERKICRLIWRARRLNPLIEKDAGVSKDIINRFTSGWTDL